MLRNLERIERLVDYHDCDYVRGYIFHDYGQRHVVIVTCGSTPFYISGKSYEYLFMFKLYILIQEKANKTSIIFLNNRGFIILAKYVSVNARIYDRQYQFHLIFQNHCSNKFFWHCH